MNEEWRIILYPFGFLAQAAFGLRFLVQWIASERAKQSVTPRLFWQLSLFANLVLLFHSLVQLHFPMSITQSQNAIMSWRNLNLLGPKERLYSLQTVVALLMLSALTIILFFAMRADATSWIAAPDTSSHSFGVHLFGIIGIICYGARFWVQWWQAERDESGALNLPFWWISLFGAFVSSTYFFIIGDWVNFIGPLLSLVPYTRNLYFLHRGAAA
jgi:lipid-A-disaccharide synthase-like uncharacterized protein